VLLLEGFERAKEGHGQAFSIVSEAGIGKSRLLYEFRKKLSSENVTFLEGRCLSYSNRVAYHPIIDIMKANLDIREDDKDSVIREKVKRGLELLEIDEASTMPYLLELLSVKDSGFDKVQMSPDAKKNRIMEVIKLFTLKGSRLRPVITAYEDLHWADKSSEVVLKSILESIPGSRVLMIFTYRPDFVHTWGGKSYHNQVNLNRLSNRECLTMVTNLLCTEKVDHEIEELILEKTEGVPFYIEEMVKSLNDLNVIERAQDVCRLVEGFKAVAIPSTIQGVIMARVDSLPEPAKVVLQTGSVIEREFTYELIHNVIDQPERELLSNLSVLKDSELIYERGIYPDSTFIFKHALTRDVVYDSILTNKQKSMHETIGKAIESLYAERADQKPELLAHHYSLSENWANAVRFGKLAAEKAYRYSQFQEALTLYEMVTEWISNLPKSIKQKNSLVDIQLEICWCNIGLGQFGKVEEVAKEAETIAESLGDETRLGIAYLGLGTAYVYRGNFEKTEYYALKAIMYLEGSTEERSLAIANLVLGACYIGQGLWKKSEPCFSKTIATYEKLGLKTEYVMGWSALPYTIVCGQLGYNLSVLGRVAEGMELLERGYAVNLEKVSNLTTKMAYCSWQGLFIALVGIDYFDAATKVDQLVELSERSDSPFMMLAFNVAKSNIMIGIENYKQVILSGQKALSAIAGKSIRTGHVANLYYNMVISSLKTGEFDKARGYFDEGRSLVELAPHWWTPRYIFLEGLILMITSNADYRKIISFFEASIKGDESVGAIVPAAQTKYYLSKILMRSGGEKGSLDMLTNIYNQFKSWGLSVWEKKCKQELEPYQF